MPRYELDDKFWQIGLKGKSFTTTAGKIGKAGHTKIKDLASAAEAKRAYEAAIAQKTKQGYALAGGKQSKNVAALEGHIAVIKAGLMERASFAVENLAKGATDGALAKADKVLGFAVPDELRRLWRLHDGQKSDETAWLAPYELLSIKQALTRRDDAIAALSAKQREKPWIPIGHRDGSYLLVHAESGELFALSGGKLTSHAKSLTAMFEAEAKNFSAPKPAKPIAKVSGKSTAPSNLDGLAKAVERAKKWMLENGAEVLVKNLAKPANDAAIKKLEMALGFAVPPELAALWKLHDGQKSEQNGFIGSLDFLGTRDVPGIRDDVMQSVRWMLEDDDMPDEAELKPDERDERWIPFGTRDSDHLVVHAGTGRVFRVAKDAPPLSLSAKSVTAFFESYAKGMEKAEYTVEEGFGDVYLAS